MATIAAEGHHVRRGLVTDAGWPFRLDISVEYQDWAIVAVCVVLFLIWCLPCVCSSMQNGCSRRFTVWVYTRLHVFYTIALYLTLAVVMFTVGVMPDWTMDDFLDYLGRFTTWTLGNMVTAIQCFCIVFGIMLMLKFRERVFYLTGLEHITVFRFDFWKALGLQTKQRPVELFIWKVDNVNSATTKMLKANDLFVEVHMGFNEPMRTRVHNNAGSSCVVRESVQLNIDESYPSQQLTLLVKDQAVIGSGEVARLLLTTRELCGIEDQTGKRRAALEYTEEFFVPLSLAPRGTVWIAIAPVEDLEDSERAPLMSDDALFLSC